MTTHYMDEAENCDRIAIIDHGRIQALDTPENLKRQVGGDIITLEAEDKGSLARKIHALYGIEVGEDEKGSLYLKVDNGAAFIPQLAARFEGKIHSISLRRPTLDDVFLHLTGKAIREEKGSALEAMRYKRLMRKSR